MTSVFGKGPLPPLPVFTCSLPAGFAGQAWPPLALWVSGRALALGAWPLQRHLSIAGVFLPCPQCQHQFPA